MSPLSHIHIRFDSSDLQSTWNQNRHLSQPAHMLRCDAKTYRCELSDGKAVLQQWSDPLEALRWMSGEMRSDERWVGYISYDFGRFFESTLRRPDLASPLPLFLFTRHTLAERAVSASAFSCSSAPLRSNFSPEEYKSAVQKAIEYIRAGDVFQINLSQQYTAGLSQQPEDIYQLLCAKFPSLYGAYLNYGDFALLSNSPELFLKVSPGRTVTTRPIKGTRPRLPGMDDELRHSAKDAAELNMIIDLERNDLGRICEIGSVKVTQPRTVEAHPTVYHGVATIEGLLRDDISFVDLLRATFPGGSITGAPKIRAMQIIDELEPSARGPYCGAIGYLAGNGSMEFNVAIRTMIIRDGLVHIPVGGGIVADSDPSSEYEETLVKAAAMFQSLSL